MKKTARQLSREIAQVLARTPSSSGRRGGHKRTSHAIKSRSEASDKLTIEQLAEMFGLPSWDRVDEMNQQHYWEMSRGADDEDAQMEAEQEAQTEVYNQWYDAVESTASKLFEQHGLELRGSPLRKAKESGRPHLLKLFPANTWNDVADKIRKTVNGVGDFHFDSLKEFLDSGPYTARQAALSHLGYVKQYPAVYGSSSARDMYDRSWR